MIMGLVLIHLQNGFMIVVMESANSSCMEDVKEMKTGSQQWKNVNNTVDMYKVRNSFLLRLYGQFSPIYVSFSVFSSKYQAEGILILFIFHLSRIN